MNGVIILSLTSFIISIILVFVSDKLKKQNDKINDYLIHLPGINCGMCGYITCEGMANAMLENEAVYKKCKILRGNKLEEMKQFLSKNIK